MPERRSVAAAFVAAFLVVQLAVPVIGLFRDRPASFSWHMYSTLGSLPDVTVGSTDGTEREVDIETLLGSRRAEVDYLPALLERLCTDGIEWVRVSQNDALELVRCR